MPRPKLPPGKGRPKGVPNKTTAALKDLILGALDKAGGEAYLVRLAKTHPAVFATLLGKILPTQMQHSGSIDSTMKPEDMTDEQIAARIAQLRQSIRPQPSP
jgi:hypothetical protein